MDLYRFIELYQHSTKLVLMESKISFFHLFSRVDFIDISYHNTMSPKHLTSIPGKEVTNHVPDIHPNHRR